RVVRGSEYVDPGFAVFERGGALAVGADVVASDLITLSRLIDPKNADAFSCIAGDEVALGCRGAADEIARGTRDRDAHRIRASQRARGVCTDEVALNGDVAAPDDRDASLAEPIDGKPPHR